jgi:hypothetical protein
MRLLQPVCRDAQFMLCPLFPRTQTLAECAGNFALCDKQTFCKYQITALAAATGRE